MRGVLRDVNGTRTFRIPKYYTTYYYSRPCINDVCVCVCACAHYVPIPPLYTQSVRVRNVPFYGARRARPVTNSCTKYVLRVDIYINTPTFSRNRDFRRIFDTSEKPPRDRINKRTTRQLIFRSNCSFRYSLTIVHVHLSFDVYSICPLDFRSHHNVTIKKKKILGLGEIPKSGNLSLPSSGKSCEKPTG